MKTVWILTWEFAGQGKYGKLISGVFANKKDAIDELESVKKDFHGTGTVTIDTTTSYEILTPGQVRYYCIEQYQMREGESK